jgi:hypothetical protein
MSRNNDVFQVLVTKGNQAILAAGAKATTLAPGQLGVFNYESGLSIDGTAKDRKFYIAVGVDTDGDAVTDDIQKSAGSHIQNKGVKYFSFRPHTPGREQITKFSGYTAECETEYGIKLELRNQEIYRTQGYNQFTKTYTTVTGACSAFETASPSGDANEITKQLKIQINNDPNGLVKAAALARQALTIVTHGTSANYASGAVMTDADVQALIAFNAIQATPATYVYTDLQLTTVTQKVKDFSSINLMYFYPRETVVIPSLVAGLVNNCVVAVTQTQVFEEGSGHDIKQLEYEALGWKDSPYRLSTLNGTSDDKFYNTVATTKYDQFAITYDEYSEGGWDQYFNNQASIVAIPGPDTVTRNGFATLMDALLLGTGFDALADDAAASNVNPLTVEQTTTRVLATDGLA